MTPCQQEDRADRPVPPEPVVTSETLFGDSRTLSILHGRDRYLLRITRAGKLILTK